MKRIVKYYKRIKSSKKGQQFALNCAKNTTLKLRKCIYCSLFDNFNNLLLFNEKPMIYI